MNGRIHKTIKLKMKMKNLKQRMQKYNGFKRDYYKQLSANKMDKL